MSNIVVFTYHGVIPTVIIQQMPINLCFVIKRGTFDTINWNMASSIPKYSVMYCIFALQFFQLGLMGQVHITSSYLSLINMRLFFVSSLILSRCYLHVILQHKYKTVTVPSS